MAAHAAGNLGVQQLVAALYGAFAFPAQLGGWNVVGKAAVHLFQRTAADIPVGQAVGPQVAG